MPTVRLPKQNSVIVVGTVTRDPELRYTPKGQPVCNFRIAVNERYKDASGEWRDAPPTFIPVVVWGPAAERCGERLKKGHHIHLEGRLRSRDWETKDGQKRFTLEVIGSRVQFLSKIEGATEEGEATEETKVAAGTASHDDSSESVATGAGNGEEIPF